MKVTSILTQAALALLVVATAPSFGQDKDEESREKAIQLSEVPQAAMDAARKALGTAPTEARIISGTSPQQYELEAKNKAGKEVSVHVSADGKVVKNAYEEHEAATAPRDDPSSCACERRGRGPVGAVVGSPEAARGTASNGRSQTG